MAKFTEWQWTQEELYALRTAAKHNCQCPTPEQTDPNPPTCVVCSMLTDQDRLNHLVFGRRIAKQLILEEFHVTPKRKRAA